MDAVRLARLLEAARLALPDGARVEVAAEDPVLQSRFHAGEAAAAALALAASASARLGELRGLPPQRLRVSVCDAVTARASLSQTGVWLTRLGAHPAAW